MNAVIHGKTHYSAKNWADFCEHIKDEVDQQCKNIELIISNYQVRGVLSK